MVGVSCSVVVVWVILIILSLLQVLGRCELWVVSGTMKIVGMSLQTKEKYADLLNGSFFFFSRRMWCLKRDVRTNALLRLLTWTRTEGEQRALLFHLLYIIVFLFSSSCLFRRLSASCARPFFAAHTSTLLRRAVCRCPSGLCICIHPFWGRNLSVGASSL